MDELLLFLEAEQGVSQSYPLTVNSEQGVSQSYPLTVNSEVV